MYIHMYYTLPLYRAPACTHVQLGARGRIVLNVDKVVYSHDTCVATRQFYIWSDWMSFLLFRCFPRESTAVGVSSPVVPVRM